MAEKKVNPVAAGVAGVVIGAAVGAAAVALSDKENRKKVKKAAGELKVKGQQAAEEMKKEALRLQKSLSNKQKPKTLKGKTVAPKGE